MSLGGPPLQWALDIASRHPEAPSAPSASGVTPAVAHDAWKHLKNVVRDGDAKSADLYDLLSHSVRETQYSFQPQGWPSLLRPLSPILNEMPGMVLERYAACQTVAFCGVFPEIRRAWASVDNSLFLWRFDKWQDVPLEYSGEEQAICAVGLVRPRRGVFVEAIQHLLVLCTTTEIVLLGVCCAPGPGGEPAAEVTLQPLPLYSVPADNVTMVAVAGTADGRIFMGGADGNLYELMYSTGEGWRNKRCSKVCHTGGLRQLLPAFVPAFLFGAPSALVDLVVDDARHILYARTQTSGIQVFDLGASGTDAPSKVAETAEFLADAARAMGGRDVFGRGSGDRKGAAVVYMAPVPPSDSQRLHLLTVTADGRRVFWSTVPARYGTSAVARPDRLRAEVARQAMSTSAGGHGRGGGALQAHQGGARVGVEVSAAHYASGVLLLACSGAGSEGRTRLFMLSRDLSIPPVGTATGAHVAVAGLREGVTELDMPVPGEACAVRSVAAARPLLASSDGAAGAAAPGVRDELSAQNLAPPPRFVVVTTAGVLELEKLRPADVLAQLLEERSAAKLEAFFKSYGAAEAAAMCVLLACAAPPATPAAIVQAAKAALDNPRLCGEPALRGDLEGGQGGGAGGGGYEETATAATGATSGGFDMGAAVPVAEPEWSGAHKGICLYLARLLQGVWEELVVAASRATPSVLHCRIPTDTLQSLEERLRALDAFLGDYLQRRRARRPGVPGDAGGEGGSVGPAFSSGAGGGGGTGSLHMPLAKRQRLEDAAALEIKRTAAVRALACRAAEACFLLRVLSEHNLGRLAARLEEGWRAALRALRFREWAGGEGGEGCAAQLVSVLLAEHLSATGGVAEDLSAALQRGCPSYFREEDKLYYRASGLLQRAEAAPSLADREALTREAVSLMMRVPLACDMGQVVPQLAYLRDFEAVVELPLRKAAALDPHDVAAGGGAAGEAARSQRYDAAYQHVMAVLRFLVDPAAAGASGEGAAAGLDRGLSEADRKLYRRTLLRRAAASDDRLFHETLYSTLIDLGAVKDLLELDTPYLERYLITAGGLAGAAPGAQIGPLNPNQVAHVEVLARYYISRQAYAAAARVYELLAERKGGAGDCAASLDERAQHYQAALLQAKSQGDSELLDRLEGKARVLALQQRLVTALEGAAVRQEGEGAREEINAALADLRSGPRELVELYNDYAVQYQLWGLCLEMVHLSGYGDAAYVRQLWDIYLKQAWEARWGDGASGSDDGAGGAEQQEEEELRAEGALDAVCRYAEDLGTQMFPSEASFPSAHVLLRLEQAAAGTWPHRTGAPLDTDRVVRAMVRICQGSYEAVVRTYETLLSVRGGDPNGEELHAPFLRLRLLRSLFLAVQAAAERLAAGDGPVVVGGPFASAARREVGALGTACEAYAAEARRLMPQDDAEQLAANFLELQRRLQPLIQQAGGYGRSLFA